MAEAHLGVTVDRPTMSPFNTATDPGTWPFDTIAADCVEQFTIQYPFNGENATVIIAKARFAATLAGDAEADDLVGSIAAARSWRRWPWSLRSMPTTTTFNQFFTDKLVDGYVRLGRAVGRRAVTLLEAQDP